MANHSEFNHKTKDSLGQLPVLTFIGERFRNSKNGHVYKITACVWVSDVDCWGFQMKRVGSPVICVRTQADFFGNNSEGKPRFVHA